MMRDTLYDMHYILNMIIIHMVYDMCYTWHMIHYM